MAEETKRISGGIRKPTAQPTTLRTEEDDFVQPQPCSDQTDKNPIKLATNPVNESQKGGENSKKFAASGKSEIKATQTDTIEDVSRGSVDKPHDSSGKVNQGTCHHPLLHNLRLHGKAAAYENFR